MVNSRNDQAEPLFQKLSTEHQEDPRHRGALARFHFYGGQQEKGIADLQAILKKYPDDKANRDTLLNALVETHRNAEAQALLSEVLKKEPQNLVAHMSRAALSLRDGKTDEAVNDLLEVLHQEPGSSPGHYYMGMAHLQRGAPGLAKQEFADSLKYQPANLSARVALCEVLLQQGASQAALELLKETPEAEKKTYFYYLAKARAEMSKGDYLASEQDLTVLTASVPDQPAGFANLGLAYAMQKDWNQAQAQFLRALQLDSQNALATEGLSRVYLATGQAGAGESTYAKLAADHPQSSAAAVGLARVREAQHKDAAAERGLRQFLSVVPNDIPALKMLADLRYKNNDPSAAEDISKQIIKAHPDDPSAYSALASIYRLERRPAEAVQQYREVLKRTPDDVMVQNALAWVIVETGGNIDEALALAQKAREKSPNNPLIADTLGWIYLKKNNVNLALGQLKDAVHGDPKNQEMLYHLGIAQYRSGNVRDAEITLAAAVAGKPTYFGVDDARRILQGLQHK